MLLLSVLSLKSRKLCRLRRSNTFTMSVFNRVTIRTATWVKDSHGLFDYESHHVIRKIFKSANCGYIVRTGNDVKLTQDLSQLQGLLDTVPLLQLSKAIDGAYTINTASQTTVYENPNDKLWLSVRNSSKEPNARFHLKGGDIIKLGRMKLKIKKVVIEGSKSTEIEDEGPIEITTCDDSPKYPCYYIIILITTYLHKS